MKNIKMFVSFVMLCLLLTVSTPVSMASALSPEEPPNQPGKIAVKAGQIVWEYEGKPLFKAEILTDTDKYRIHTAADSSDGRTTQLLILTAKRWRDSIEVRGTIQAGHESFPCEADRRDSGLRIVRHSHGLSHSLLNRAVYDRSRDWIFSVDHNPRVKITPSKEDKLGRSYAVEISGREIILRFRPRYYQKHRGLKYYEPWTYKVWPKPVVGWCSWFAYFQDINEQNVKKVADVIADVLLPYGYEYLQIDDGFQRGHGLPELWLEPNEKFPRGLKDLADYIKSRGLKPGIWTNVAFNQMDFAEKNRALFVLDSEGRPARGNWIDISIDGSNPEAVDRLIRPVYKGLKQMGWQYFKVDALRHLRYEGYNSQPEYFRKKGVDRVEAFRTLVKAIREEVGREHFMLGCWGIRPELIGIIDSCRIGTDGYSFAGLSQYNSFNNVVWLNDPDHIELSPAEAYRSTMATSLTGSLFLLTDKPEVYLTPMVEPAKRSTPVLYTYPGQVFDVDPSRSENLHRVDVEVSGSGPRVFDASREPKVHLFLLEINKPFGNWMLLGRTGGDFEDISFSELGLDPNQEYYVYEFWSKRLLGSFQRSFLPGKIDPRFNCQLFCIRRRLDRPQVIATNRHITCGGYDLETVYWDGSTLSGSSHLVGGDIYILYATEPPGYSLRSFWCGPEAEVLKTEKQGRLILVSIRSEKNSSVSWKLQF